MSFIPSDDFLVEVAKGNVSNHSIVIVDGRNTDVDVAIVDIGMEDANFTWLTTATTLEAISTSANDTAAGSGARIITIEGLDANFDIISEDVTMNGTSATVATTATFIRVNKSYVKETGTYASTSGGSNDGDITVRVSGGGASQSFISTETISNGESQDAKYTIPNNHIAVVLGVGLNVSSSKIGKLIFQIRPDADIVAAPFSPRFVGGIIDGESGRHTIPREELHSTLAGKTDIWASAEATAVNTETSTRIALLLIDQS